MMGMRLSLLLLFAQDQTRRKSEWSQCNRDTDGHWWTLQVWRKSSVQGEPWSNWYNLISAGQLIFPHDRGMWLSWRASKTTEASLGSSPACTYLESVSGYLIG